VVIDMHNHFIPQPYVDLARQHPEQAGSSLVLNKAGQWCVKPAGSDLPLGLIPASAELCDPETKLGVMDRMGVDTAVFSPPTYMFMYGADADLAMRAARSLNEQLATVCAAQPDRFVGLATAPLQAPEQAAAELERAVRDLGLRGAEIGTSVNGLNLDDPSLLPFFERAQALDVPIFIHPNTCAIEARRVGKYYFANTIGFLLDSTLAVGSLIFGGVLERLPRLKVYLAHAGGFFPYQVGRFDHARETRAECQGVISKPPSEYLRQMYFDSIVHSPAALAYLLSLVGSDHIVLGTDDPFDTGEDRPVEFVESIPGLDDAARRAILGDNAARLLGLAR
jgi:aminocarboxymuconate-semialdehyde decarboxylase